MSIPRPGDPDPFALTPPTAADMLPSLLATATLCAHRLLNASANPMDRRCAEGLLHTINTYFGDDIDLDPNEEPPCPTCGSTLTEGFMGSPYHQKHCVGKADVAPAS